MTSIQRKTAAALRLGLKKLGPRGEHWCKKRMRENGSYCVLGVIEQVVSECRPRMALGSHALTALTLALPYGRQSVIWYNDDWRTKFADIKQLFQLAIASLEARA